MFKNSSGGWEENNVINTSPLAPQPRKSNIAFLKLVFCLWGVNETLQPELNHSKGMMASKEQRISPVMLTGSVQADIPEPWADRPKSSVVAHLNPYVFTFPSSVL